MSFEKYWEEQESRFKEIARNEFEKIKLGKFIATVEVDTDDDFSLDFGTKFEMFGQTEKELANAIINKLEKTKLTFCKTWSITSDYGKKKIGDHSDKWLAIRNETIQRLKKGETEFSLGGNQTISIIIQENTPKNITTKSPKPN